MNSRKSIGYRLLLALGGLGLVVSQVSANSPESQVLERGRYLVKIGGCNDCHTPGYLMSEGKVPEDSWLTGDSFGWRGPWGTTYAPNLRIVMQGMTEEEWLSFAKKLKARPPMPWFTLNQMHDEDLRAIYQFIRQLKPVGHPAPDFVPPDQEPAPPYALFPSPPAESQE